MYLDWSPFLNVQTEGLFLKHCHGHACLPGVSHQQRLVQLTHYMHGPVQNIINNIRLYSIRIVLACYNVERSLSVIKQACMSMQAYTSIWNFVTAASTCIV